MTGRNVVGGTEKIEFGTNTEGYLCVWDGKGTMHYMSETPNYHQTQTELNQAKILTLLFRIAKKVKVNVKL